MIHVAGDLNSAPVSSVICNDCIYGRFAGSTGGAAPLRNVLPTRRLPHVRRPRKLLITKCFLRAWRRGEPTTDLTMYKGLLQGLQSNEDGNESKHDGHCTPEQKHTARMWMQSVDFHFTNSFWKSEILRRTLGRPALRVRRKLKSASRARGLTCTFSVSL
jgi:hypothetical protein